jgi:hypothetical protein
MLWRRCLICGHPFKPLSKDHGQGSPWECQPCIDRAYEQIRAAHLHECTTEHAELQQRIEVYQMAVENELPIDCESVHRLLRRTLRSHVGTEAHFGNMAGMPETVSG